MFYAKSDPKQSISEHTKELFIRLEILKSSYGDYINSILPEEEIDDFWNTLYEACKYHDFGKVYTPFQNLILEKLEEKKIDTKFLYDSVKHEQLSPLFINKDELNISSDYKKILFQAILFHHDRYNIFPDEGYIHYIEKIVAEDMNPRLDEITEQLGLEKIDELDISYLNYLKLPNRIYSKSTAKLRKIYLRYILIKGLLNRLDHSASANVEIEIKSNPNIACLTEKFMKNSKFDKNAIQVFCKENCDKNIIVIGSTGIGKTEAAFLWSNGSKSFFTLPLVVSINAIYDRIKDKIQYDNVGILHATSLDYIEYREDKKSMELYEQSKNFASEFTVCTIDQIFPFVFRYKGFEKIYATLAYSKIIIDEIQAYSPHIVAVLLKGLKMIYDIGGKFMIMTATLPTIYKDYLKEAGIEFEENEFVKEIKRHRVMCLNTKIDDEINHMTQLGKEAKVLVIVNTVNKAIEMYEKISDISDQNIHLLHARFTMEDKSNLEEKIKEFSNSKETGIWITTQIVEASLDISFDYLFTELSTLDSLFQRMGRCYRSKEYRGELPNVYVCLENVSGVGVHSVYNPDIHRKSVEIISGYQGDFLEEKEKIEMVKKLYDKETIKDTHFYNEFLKSLAILDCIEDNESAKKEAQNMLRQIQSVKVIPRKLYDHYYELFDHYEKEKEWNIKKQWKKQIEKLSINIRKSLAKPYLSDFDKVDEYYIVDLVYSKETGLKVGNKDTSIGLEERML